MSHLRRAVTAVVVLVTLLLQGGVAATTAWSGGGPRGCALEELAPAAAGVALCTERLEIHEGLAPARERVAPAALVPVHARAGVERRTDPAATRPRRCARSSPAAHAADRGDPAPH